MATAAEIKAANGGARKGALSKREIGAWNDAHPDDLYETGPGRDDTGQAPDYPADDFEDMFPAPGEDTVLSPEGETDLAETPPRRAAAKKSRPRGGGWLPWGKPAGKGKGKKKARVSTEDLLGSVWRAGAKLATPLPPLQRTLRMQAPVAGMLLEDAVRDTMIDPLLQPLARMAEAGKTVAALAGPPAFVTAISVHAAQRAALDPPQPPHPLFMSVATEGLRSCLMTWCEIAGPKFEIALAREREFEEKFGQSVDGMIQLIFAPLPDPADEEAVAAEEDAIRRAQGIL